MTSGPPGFMKGLMPEHKARPIATDGQGSLNDNGTAQYVERPPSAGQGVPGAKAREAKRKSGKGRKNDKGGKGYC